jgi:hypothetical protein
MTAISSKYHFSSWPLALALLIAACADDDGRDGADAGRDDATNDVGGDAGDTVENPDVDDVHDAVSVDASPDVVVRPMDTDEACRATAVPICAGLFDCMCDLDARPFGDEDDCVAHYVATCAGGTEGELETLIVRGDVVWVRENVEACAAELAEQTERCQFNADRGSPRCRFTYADAASLGATCLARQPGVPCARGFGACSEDLVCTALPVALGDCSAAPCAAPFVCEQGACVEPGGVDAPCSFDASCDAGLVCISGACGARLPVGEQCVADTECASGLRCVDGRCAASGAAEVACNDSGACGNDLVCAADFGARTCGPGVGEGERCAGEAPCAPGLRCDPVEAVCRAPAAAGEPCEATDGCTDGLLCVRDVEGNGSCAAPPSLDEECLQTADAFCEPGLGCDFDSGRCAVGGGDGEACLVNGMYGYSCAEGLGCAFEPAGSFCRPLGGEGDGCTNDATCSPGTFCNFETLACENYRAERSGCSAGNECGPEQTCARGADGVLCRRLPAVDEACDLECADGLVCAGFGGVCAPSICGIR